MTVKIDGRCGVSESFLTYYLHFRTPFLALSDDGKPVGDRGSSFLTLGSVLVYLLCRPWFFSDSLWWWEAIDG